MELKDQVSNFGLSKRLKELGVKQESEWYWVKRNNKWVIEIGDNVSLAEESYSAPTVAELGEMLPKDIKIENRIFPLRFQKFEGGWSCYYISPEMYFQASTEANARAKLLIYLLENKLLTLQ